MRRAWIATLFAGLALAGCTLAGDVTPPPALATAQAEQPILQPASTTATSSSTTTTQATSGPSTAPASSPAPTSVTTAGTTQPSAVIATMPPSGAQTSGIVPNAPAGEAIFAVKCASCHGTTGMGDGAQAGGLPVPPAKLGDPSLARAAVPSDWYKVVTQGRMDRFMPPFGPSLSDQQRWDVVAYALSLSATADDRTRGRTLYEAQQCAQCHGDAQGNPGTGPGFQAPGLLEQRSASGLADVILKGSTPVMPAYADKLSQDDAWALVAYIRSWGFGAAPTAEATSATPGAAATPGTPVGEGTIKGTISNGTPGGQVPAGLQVTLQGFDGNTAALTMTTTADANGAFSFANVPAVSGRIFGLSTEYKGTVYFSQGGHITDPSQPVDMPLKIYETTTDAAQISVERIHVLFDFSTPGTVQVIELWILSNAGDRTVIGGAGKGVISIDLPSGATNLSFQDGTLGGRFLQTDKGFSDTEPIPPGSSTAQTVFTFNLPYDQKLDFSQPTGYPVTAVIALVQAGGPTLSGDGLQDTGTQAVSGQSVQTYSHGPISAGGVLSLTVSGAPGTGAAGSAGGVSTTDILVGVVILALALIVAGLWWFRSRRHADEGEDTPDSELEAEDRESLLRAIAGLDDDFAHGKVEEEPYRRRRELLKRQLLEDMRDDD